jgi:hypothetical protein
MKLISHHGRVRKHIDRRVPVSGHGACFLEEFALRAGLRVITSVKSTRREARSYTPHRASIPAPTKYPDQTLPRRYSPSRCIRSRDTGRLSRLDGRYTSLSDE